jgi:hypothetical protein
MGVTCFTTDANGTTIDGVTLKNGTVDVNGTASGIILDADQDTHIQASTDDVIEFTIGGSVDFTFAHNELKLAAASSIVIEGATGDSVVPFMPILAQQTLAGAGAITITEPYTTWDTTAGAAAGTLVDGEVKGHYKKIQMIVDGGDGTLTPTNLNGGTNITFADVGDTVELLFDGTSWTAIALYNVVDGATAPVLA